MGVYGSPDLSSNNITNTSEKNMIYCSYCGFRYSKKIKKCPQCNKKHSQPFYHKWWFWFFVLIMAISVSSSNTRFSSSISPRWIATMSPTSRAGVPS